MNSKPAYDMKEIFRKECLEQPDRLYEMLRAYSFDGEVRGELERVKKIISKNQPVLWLGMGASYCSSISGATRLSSSGRPSFSIEAGEWLHFGLSTWDQVAGPILVTTSGESAELVELCRMKEKHPRILICNSPGSSCWNAAEFCLPILAGPERGNATKTYMNSSAICTILASELVGQPWQEEAKCIPKLLASCLSVALERREEMEQFCHEMKTLEVLGRGSALGGALMGALCVREMTTWRANAHSGGSFRHGPFLDVDGSHVATILALGRTAEMGRRLGKDCLAKGGKVILIVDQGPVENSDRLLTIKIEQVPEGWEGLTSVVVLQALTLVLIERYRSSYVRTQTTVQ